MWNRLPSAQSGEGPSTKNRTTLSSYSYECKDCTKKRVKRTKKKKVSSKWEYPDW